MVFITNMQRISWAYSDELCNSSPMLVAPRLGRPVEQHGADMTNCLGGIQAFGTHVDAVLNTVATEHAEGVIQLGQTVFGRGITTVGEESVRLQ